jgi:hypothetical protein
MSPGLFSPKCLLMKLAGNAAAMNTNRSKMVNPALGSVSWFLVIIFVVAERSAWILRWPAAGHRIGSTPLFGPFLLIIPDKTKNNLKRTRLTMKTSPLNTNGASMAIPMKFRFMSSGNTSDTPA